MRGTRAKAIRRQEKRVRKAGELYGDDPSDRNESLLDKAQEELKRLRKKGEPIVRR